MGKDVTIKVQAGGGGSWLSGGAMVALLGGGGVALWYFDPFGWFRRPGNMDPTEKLSKKDCAEVEKAVDRGDTWWKQVGYGFRNLPDLFMGKGDLDRLQHECACVEQYSMSCKEKAEIDRKEEGRRKKCKNGMATLPTAFEAAVGYTYKSWGDVEAFAKSWWAENGKNYEDCPKVKAEVFSYADKIFKQYQAGMKLARDTRKKENDAWDLKITRIRAQIDAGKFSRDEIEKDLIGLQVLSKFIDPGMVGAGNVHDPTFMAEYNKARPDWRAAQAQLLDYYDKWAKKCTLSQAEHERLHSEYLRAGSPVFADEDELSRWVDGFMHKTLMPPCARPRVVFWLNEVVEEEHRDVKKKRVEDTARDAEKRTHAARLANSTRQIRMFYQVKEQQLSDETIEKVSALSYSSVTPLGVKVPNGYPLYMWQGVVLTKASDIYKVQGFRKFLPELSKRESYAYWLEWYGHWEQLSSAEKAKTGSYPPPLNKLTNDADVAIRVGIIDGTHKMHVTTDFTRVRGVSDIEFALGVPIGSVWWQPWDMQTVHKMKGSNPKFIPKKEAKKNPCPDDKWWDPQNKKCWDYE